MASMKDFEIRIRDGGDDAVAAMTELWEMREKILFDITDAFTRARWIPVSERLPEVNATVLAVTRAFPKDIRLAQMASHDGVMWRFCDMDDDDVDSFGITHWMPLPAPPTDSK